MNLKLSESEIKKIKGKLGRRSIIENENEGDVEKTINIHFTLDFKNSKNKLLCSYIKKEFNRLMLKKNMDYKHVTGFLKGLYYCDVISIKENNRLLFHIKNKYLN